MTIPMKVVASCISAIGVSSAVGVPIAMKTFGAEDAKVGGLSKGNDEILMRKCDSENFEGLAEVSFGDNSVGGLCYKIDRDEGYDPEYDNLFQKKWKSSSENWKNNMIDPGTQQCESTSSKWVILSLEENAEYFGLCRGTSLETTLFVKKKRNEQDEQGMEFQICKSDCGENSKIETSGFKELQNRKNNKGQKVVFGKKKVHQTSSLNS